MPSEQTPLRNLENFTSVRFLLEPWDGIKVNRILSYGIARVLRPTNHISETQTWFRGNAFADVENVEWNMAILIMRDQIHGLLGRA